MKFHIFLPSLASKQKCPVLFFLSGLTCTDENFMHKSGVHRYAEREGLIIVAPDTSPRGLGYPGEADSWDFGVGAGFYVDATQEPWSKGYRMFSYVTQELRRVIEEQWGQSHADMRRCGIFGHSMGGHGALICALKTHDVYSSVSAFAPISNPTQCPWGQNAFSRYLGPNTASWKDWDASELLKNFSSPKKYEILVDVGLADKFLSDKQLLPESLQAACDEAASNGRDTITLTLRYHEGYDHGYYFISTFIEDHIKHHARVLHAL